MSVEIRNSKAEKIRNFQITNGKFGNQPKNKTTSKKMPHEWTYEKTHTYPEFMVRGVMRFHMALHISLSEVFRKCLMAQK